MKHEIGQSGIDLGRWSHAQIEAANTAASTYRHGRVAVKEQIETCDEYTVNVEQERAIAWREAYLNAMETGRLFNPKTTMLIGEWPVDAGLQTNFKGLVAFADAFIRRCQRRLDILAAKLEHAT